MTIEWSEPPSARRGRPRSVPDPEWLDQIKASPGQWALVEERLTPLARRRIMTMLRNRHGEHISLSYRTYDDGENVWARWDQ